MISSENLVAEFLVAADAVFLTPAEPIVLSSGLCSPVYMDMRKLLAVPKIWAGVIEKLTEAAVGFGDVEIVAGVAVGGIPHSTSVALRAGLPSCFVRKHAKGHGRGKAIEGADVAGRKVVLIEDVIATGGSSLDALISLNDAGAEIVGCVAIAGHDLHNAYGKFAAAGVPLCMLAPFSAVLEAVQDSGRFLQEDVDEIRSWHSDPHSWNSTR